MPRRAASRGKSPARDTSPARAPSPADLHPALAPDARSRAPKVPDLPRRERTSAGAAGRRAWHGHAATAVRDSQLSPRDPPLCMVIPCVLGYTSAWTWGVARSGTEAGPPRWRARWRPRQFWRCGARVAASGRHGEYYRAFKMGWGLHRTRRVLVTGWEGQTSPCGGG